MDLNETIPQLGGTPAIIIATAAALGGDEPQDRIVVCGFHRARLLAVVPIALDDRPSACIDRIRATASVLARMTLTQCALIGFGQPIAYPVKRLITALHTYGIGVPLAVRVTGGRCYSYLPDDHPADGVPYPPGDTADQPDRVRMRRATDTAVELIRGAYRVAGGLAKRDHRSASCRFIRDAVTRYTTGGRLTDIEAATLAIQLHDDRIRDEAFSLIRHHGPLTGHIKLWTDLAHRAVAPFTGPAFTVLAFAAWQHHDWSGAKRAIDQARTANPADDFAAVLAEAIDVGVQPHTIDVETPGELAERYSHSDHGLTSDLIAELTNGPDLTS